MNPLDPAELQILIGRLTAVADEMGAVLRRAAFSPNIKERADCSAAVFDAAGRELVQAAHIPVHLGSMPASVEAAIDAAARLELVPGDQLILNDPFCGGTHLNDVTVVAPCIGPEGVVGWVANRAHHADLGGMVPGSISPDATDVFQEGLRIPPVRFTDEVRALVIASSRTPAERSGDIDAQLGANRIGVERFLALGALPFSAVLDYGERRMRAALRELPSGTWEFEDVLDSCGPRPDQQRPARIAVRVTIDNDEITFDFTASDRQRRGNVNAVRAVTVSSVAFAIRAATDPTIPANAGSLRPVTIVTTPGSIVDATPPAAVGAGNVEVSQRVADVCLGALAQVVPERIGAASQGTMNNVLVGGNGWVYYETIGGGQGGRFGRPGMSGVHTAMTNTRNTPIEALERSYPMRVLRYALRRRSGGRGAAAGGDGIVRDLQILEDASISLVTERRVTRPWGLAGGEPGLPGENWLLPQNDESRAVRLPDKVTLSVGAGDVLRIVTPGGGGWGPANVEAPTEASTGAHPPGTDPREVESLGSG